MINNDLKIEKREGGNYEPLPENIYQVELLDITLEERATYDTRSKPEAEQKMETVLSFQFTLLSGRDKEESLRGRNVWANFIPTYLYISTKNGKNKLYQIIEALIGKELSQEEEAIGIDGFFLNSLVGRQCRIGTKHKKSGDKIFDNIETYYRADDLLTPLTKEEKERATTKKSEETDEAKEFNKSVEDVNVGDIPF